LPNALAVSGPLKGLFFKAIQPLTIDYNRPGRQLPCQEVWYELEGDIAYLYFSFHNGAMSTEQCRLLLSVYQHIATQAINVIVLMGGAEFWSNGIHLNAIENADSPADESWANINAMDDLIYQIITTLDKLTISAVAGNAGAGGAILAIATDLVWARDGVILNPHYKNMGELYGSEYWTYLLPKRVGLETATALTEQRLPVSAKKAWRIGLIDQVLDKQHQIFYAQVKHLAKTYSSDPGALRNCLTNKAKTRCFDESTKALSVYRQFELTQMYANFYGNDEYHDARKRFVYKLGGETRTPENIAIHRPKQGSANTVLPGSLGHFVWQDVYRMGDETMDSQHQDLFVLADRLLTCESAKERKHHMQLFYQHVKSHFDAEEEPIKKLNVPIFDDHINEHRLMLKSLADIDLKINREEWKPQDIETFMDKWGKHIIHSDMAMNAHVKKYQLQLEH